MLAFLITFLMLHPGHMTRLEMRVSDDSHRIEVAMKINASDLESAIKRRLGVAVDLEAWSDEEAKKNIGDYLKSTLFFHDKPLSNDQFKWIGWQPQSTHAWLFFELCILDLGKQDCRLQIKSLYEVEPEMQHVVVLSDNAGDRTIIVRNADSPVTITRSRS